MDSTDEQLIDLFVRAFKIAQTKAKKGKEGYSLSPGVLDHHKTLRTPNGVTAIIHEDFYYFGELEKKPFEMQTAGSVHSNSFPTRKFALFHVMKSLIKKLTVSQLYVQLLAI